MKNPNVNELYSYLDSEISSSLSCDWDNDGLMVASCGEKTVDRVLLTLDVSKKALKTAKELGCDAVISHHPLIFKPLKSVTEKDSTADIVITAVKEEIAVMSFHTRLDAADGGVNDALSEVIGVRDTECFGPSGEEIGRIGMLKEELDLKKFALFVKSALGADSVRVTAADPTKKVRKIAVLGGSGKDYVIPAACMGADVLVTGEIGYNTAVTAEDLGIAVIEAGHFFTENPVLSVLRSMISVKYPDILFEYVNSNPTLTL